jgi:hypothetical protein
VCIHSSLPTLAQHCHDIHSLHPENFAARLRSTCHMILQQLLARQEAIVGVLGFLYVC